MFNEQVGTMQPVTEEKVLAEAIPVVFDPGMSLDAIEKAVILQTLRQQKFNRTHAARVLGIGIRTLQRKLKRYRQDILAHEMLENVAYGN